jgi:hypothetical protein
MDERDVDLSDFIDYYPELFLETHSFMPLVELVYLLAICGPVEHPRVIRG